MCGRSHFFRLRPRSSFKIFESVPGFETSNFSNLIIRLLFRLRLQSSIQQKFSHVFTEEKTTQTRDKRSQIFQTPTSLLLHALRLLL